MTHVFVNDAYCKFFGKKPEEILGTRFHPQVPEDDDDKIRHNLASLTPERPFTTMEHRIIMPDGTIRWQQWSDRAIFDERGTLIEFQSVGRDITGIKKAEDDLRAA